MLDYSPLLNIKPYVPLFDQRDARIGWISSSSQKLHGSRISDGRY
jgi:tRNA (Thr-GGU) A37 N-methylase